MDSPFSLSGKTILVTGASSGIGRAIALLCARMGASVIVTGRDESRLQQVFEALSGSGHKQVIADLACAEQRNQLVQEVPCLDGIAFCAGIGHRKPSRFLTEEDIHKVMSVNFDAVVLLTTALTSSKKINKKGSLVFLSSRTADIPSLSNALYSASKGALKSYARCLSLELAPRQIRVNCICPAMVWTPLVLGEGVSKEELEILETKYPLKRYGQPEDVANLTVFLLSDASLWMTGSCIDITGGSVEI